MARHLHHAPADCPVCHGEFVVTAKGCMTCGSTLTGEFAPCDFCALDASELDLVRRFLTARGDLSTVDGAALDAVVAKLEGSAAVQSTPTATPQEQILARVAAGEIPADVAAELIAHL